MPLASCHSFIGRTLLLIATSFVSPMLLWLMPQMHMKTCVWRQQGLGVSKKIRSTQICDHNKKVHIALLMHSMNKAWLVPNVGELILMHLKKRVCLIILLTYFGAMPKFKLKDTCAGFQIFQKDRDSYIPKIKALVEQLFPRAARKSLKLWHS